MTDIKNIPELLHKQASTIPQQTYLIFKDQEFTYVDISQTAKKMSAALKEIGLEKSDRIGLLCPNHPEFIFTYFAAMNAGTIIVPINVMLKKPEVEFILNDCGAKAFIYDPKFREYIDTIKVNCKQLQTSIEINSSAYKDLKEHSLKEFTQSIHEDDPAAIIYTSGTTGKPKGVILTHKNYISDVENATKWCKVTAKDRFMCILPLFHVNGQVVSTLMPLMAGATQVLTEGFNPKSFLSDLAKYKITSFSAVPTIYSYMNNMPNIEEHDLSYLRACICGAAPMPVEVFNTFEKKFNASILEGYGLSEGTCVSTVNPLDGRPRKIGSIGLALTGQEIQIQDDKSNQLASGEVGEICIKGTNVMKGYFNNPEATAATLQDGWLHTGDLGYQDDEGYFYIVGRKKEMIIRGGENIYPKEIEEVLYKHEKIAECAVCGVPDSVWGEEVVAFLISKNEQEEISLKEIRSYLKDKLADYKRPRKVFTVNELPKTATGKIRKGELIDKYRYLWEK